MTKRTYINNLKVSKTANIRGFVERIRDTRYVQFIILRDISGKVQITVVKDQTPEIAEMLTGLLAGSVLSVTGKYVANPGVKDGGHEVIPTKVEILSTAKPSPIDAESGPEHCMDYRWLDLRDPKKSAYLAIQSIGNHAMREWFVKNKFTEIFTPKISAISSEGGADVFKLKYYGRDAFLTQSPQLYKQMAIASGFEKYFEFTPMYRAEKSHTNRHCTEVYALDMEMAYVDSHHTVMDNLEAVVRHAILQIGKKCSDIIKNVIGIDNFPTTVPKFPRITLNEAYQLLKSERNFIVPDDKQGDLNPEGERLLSEIIKEKYNSDFVFIIDYPFLTRAFYSQKHDDNPTLSKTFDLLYKGIEITSGAQREHRPEHLRQNLIDKGLNPADFEQYVQFFEYGCPPHGGFGFGLARLYTKMFDLPNIRDAIFLFRGPDRLTP